MKFEALSDFNRNLSDSICHPDRESARNEPITEITINWLLFVMMTWMLLKKLKTGSQLAYGIVFYRHFQECAYSQGHLTVGSKKSEMQYQRLLLLICF
jgi:hypothetical protein